MTHLTIAPGDTPDELEPAALSALADAIPERADDIAHAYVFGAGTDVEGLDQNDASLAVIAVKTNFDRLTPWKALRWRKMAIDMFRDGR